MGVSEGYTEYYLIMEFYDSFSLHSVIFTENVRDTYKLNLAQKNHITKKLCLALNFLHLEDNPIIHRDVKPGNTLVEWAGERRFLYNIKLCDLGLFKCKNIANNLKTSFGNCQVRGTQYYNVPEVIRREEPSTKSDVWSTACTLVELYSGRSAWEFPETNIIKDMVREAVLQGKSPSIKGVPGFLCKILLKCFTHDRDDSCSIEEVLSVVQKEIAKKSSM